MLVTLIIAGNWLRWTHDLPKVKGESNNATRRHGLLVEMTHHTGLRHLISVTAERDAEGSGAT